MINRYVYRPFATQMAITTSLQAFQKYIMGAIVKLAFAFSLLIPAGCSTVKEPQTSTEAKNSALHLNSRTVSNGMPGFHNAIYVENKGTRLLSGDMFSEDNGHTWSKYTYKPDFHSGLPYGYRRDRVTSVRDHFTGRIITIVNSLDTPGLDPGINEPPVAQFTYYLALYSLK